MKIRSIWKKFICGIFFKEIIIYYYFWHVLFNRIMWQINLDSYESYLFWPQSSYYRLALDPTSKLFGVCPTNFAPQKGNPWHAPKCTILGLDS